MPFAHSTNEKGTKLDQIRHRRERRKVAQRAFRQRQIDTIQKLRDENEALKAALASATENRMCCCGGEPCRALSIRTPVAGSRPQVSEGQFPEPFGTAQQDIGSFEVRHSRLVTGLLGEENIIQMQGRKLEYVPVDELVDEYRVDSIDWSNAMSTSTAGTISVHHSNSTSEFHDIWSAPRFAAPPPDIVPFLGHTAYTVAGQIFWATMAFAHTALKAIQQPNPPVEAKVVTSAIFGASLIWMPLSDMTALLSERIAFRKGDYSFDNLYHGKRKSREYSFQTMKSYHESKPEPNLLDSFAVERELQEQLGPSFDRLRNLICGRQAMAGSREATRDLVRAMSRNATCYGKGPRWDRETVIRLASQWAIDGC